MIEFGKITGEVKDSYIQVRLRTGECLFAPIAVVGTSVTVPSDKWVTNNKDNFLALVSYEKDMYISPIIIGFYPVKGASSSEYNTVERIIAEFEKLVSQLLKAKVNTQIGPQPFMQDTIKVLSEVKDELKNISDDVLKLNL